MFEGFALERVDVGEAVLRVRHGGAGPPLLLLHGHPRTHATWHRVAPLLAGDHTVVCPDLRGYGESSKPPTTRRPRAVLQARDGARLRRADARARARAVRGRRARSRRLRRRSGTALDHPRRGRRALAVLDAVPIAEALDRCDARFAASWWHWFFLGQTDKPAERVISADPDAWYTAGPGAHGRGGVRRLPPRDPRPGDGARDVRGLPRRARRSTARTTRPTAPPAAASPARRSSRGRSTTTCEELYGDPLAIWRAWADDLRGARIDSGHHMAEEAPAELAAALRAFLSGS